MKRFLAPALFLSLLISFGACARSLATGPVAAGVAAAEEGRWEEAVRHWREALAKDPHSAAAHNNLAVAYEKLGAWEDARREYESALRADPANPEIKGNYEAFQARLEAGRGKTP